MAHLDQQILSGLHWPPLLPGLRHQHQQCLSSIARNYSTAAHSPAAPRKRRGGREICYMASSSSSPSSTQMYAKEMERVAAKEALLLSIKDAAGDKLLNPTAANTSAQIEVNERIVSLERLNPTPRPTTSPLLEGRWEFKWIGAGSPGQIAARVVLQRFPSAFVALSNLTILILDRSAKANATVRAFNTILSSVSLTSKLSVEGPSRLKEEYVEGFLSSPSVQDGSVPPQFQYVYGQFLNTIQRLPHAVREPISQGIKVPLAGTFERRLLISYLDDEILVARDVVGVPEVLLRLPEISSTDTQFVPEYVS